MKTKPTDASVAEFLDKIEDDKKREDAYRLWQIFKEVTAEEAKMWGGSIVGFGQYHYKYDSGREGDWMLTGFSPRKAQFSLYIMAGFKRFDELMQKLGKYKTGISCLYVKKLEDIDEDVLRELIAESVDFMKERYGN